MMIKCKTRPSSIVLDRSPFVHLLSFQWLNSTIGTTSDSIVGVLLDPRWQVLHSAGAMQVIEINQALQIFLCEYIILARFHHPAHKTKAELTCA